MNNGSSVSPFVEAGKKGASKRWGPQRRLQIGDLTPDQRRLVLSLIEAHRVVNSARDRDDVA